MSAEYRSLSCCLRGQVYRYIVFELLKNVSYEFFYSSATLTDPLFTKSFRATRLKHPNVSQLPPIGATIVSGNNHVTIRISDQGETFAAFSKESVNERTQQVEAS